jgi:hypothetical protein
MPNQRREGQMFVGFQADQELIEQMDAARGRTDRSLFIREAIADKLRKMNIHVPERLVYPPDRAKKVVRLSSHKLAHAAEAEPPYRAKRQKKASHG